jgi:hypothetical protein
LKLLMMVKIDAIVAKLFHSNMLSIFSQSLSNICLYRSDT